MPPRFKVGDVAWFCPKLEKKLDRVYFLVVLKSQVSLFSPRPSQWRVTYLYAWTQGSTLVHSVQESHLSKTVWTFAGYLRRDYETALPSR